MYRITIEWTDVDRSIGSKNQTVYETDDVFGLLAILAERKVTPPRGTLTEILAERIDP